MFFVLQSIWWCNCLLIRNQFFLESVNQFFKKFCRGIKIQKQKSHSYGGTDFSEKCLFAQLFLQQFNVHIFKLQTKMCSYPINLRNSFPINLCNSYHLFLWNKKHFLDFLLRDRSRSLVSFLVLLNLFVRGRAKMPSVPVFPCNFFKHRNQPTKISGFQF